MKDFLLHLSKVLGLIVFTYIACVPIGCLMVSLHVHGLLPKFLFDNSIMGSYWIRAFSWAVTIGAVIFLLASCKQLLKMWSDFYEN